MHIVILADPVDNQSAGVHVYTKNLIENLLKVAPEHKFTFIHERENDFFDSKDHHIIPKKNGIGSGTKRKFFEIPKLLEKLQPDLVFEPCHIGPFRVPEGTKKATMIHDLTPVLFPHFHINRSAIVHKLLLKKVLRDSHLILTASNNTKKDIKNYSNTSAPIKVIPLGLDHIEETKEGRMIKSPYLLYLGTIEPRKNLELLIDAFEELHLDHKLVLAGEIGWKADKVIAKAKRNPNIVLTKFIDEDERSSLYKHADAFIYPSIYEGFGFPPLEALKHGTPVIASNGGSLGEILDGQAKLFNPHKKEELKAHIKKVLECEPAVDNSFLEKYQWEKTALQTIKAFEEICQN